MQIKTSNLFESENKKKLMNQEARTLTTCIIVAYCRKHTVFYTSFNFTLLWEYNTNENTNKMKSLKQNE